MTIASANLLTGAKHPQNKQITTENSTKTQESY